MISLNEAWAWYRAAQQNAKLVYRLATKHWDALPSDPLLDDGREQIANAARVAGDPLDDLAVVVLFSVFEAAVREHLLLDMEADAKLLTNAILKAAADDARERVEVGSFYRVMEPLKTPEMHDLIEQVNQVRRYRNWVAHGRRGSKVPDQVDPQTAYDRLQAFLQAISKEG